MKKKKKAYLVVYFLYGINIICICSMICMSFQNQFFIASCLFFLVLTLFLVIKMEKNEISKRYGDEIRKTKLDYKIESFENSLYNKSFGIRLFASIIGIIFICISITPIWHFIIKLNIKNNGQPTNATISYKGIESYDTSYTDKDLHSNFSLITYEIKYFFNNMNYTYSFLASNSSYKKGDTIYIYCTNNDIFVPLELSKYILQILIISPISFIVGFKSLKEYNVFKRKKEI